MIQCLQQNHGQYKVRKTEEFKSLNSRQTIQAACTGLHMLHHAHWSKRTHTNAPHVPSTGQLCQLCERHLDMDPKSVWCASKRQQLFKILLNPKITLPFHTAPHIRNMITPLFPDAFLRDPETREFWSHHNAAGRLSVFRDKVQSWSFARSRKSGQLKRQKSTTVRIEIKIG